MRDLKFRAWHLGADWFIPQFVQLFGLAPSDQGMLVSYSGVIRGEKNHPNIKAPVQRQTRTNELPTSVVPMQYTGLKDKHGREAYESDLLSNGYLFLGEAMFDQGTYTCEDRHECYIDRKANGRRQDFHNLEIIGNIYENPELLGEASK